MRVHILGEEQVLLHDLLAQDEVARRILVQFQFDALQQLLTCRIRHAVLLCAVESPVKRIFHQSHDNEGMGAIRHRTGEVVAFPVLLIQVRDTFDIQAVLVVQHKVTAEVHDHQLIILLQMQFQQLLDKRNLLVLLNQFLHLLQQQLPRHLLLKAQVRQLIELLEQLHHIAAHIARLLVRLILVHGIDQRGGDDVIRLLVEALLRLTQASPLHELLQVVMILQHLHISAIGVSGNVRDGTRSPHTPSLSQQRQQHSLGG